MSDLSATVAAGFSRHYLDLARRVHGLAEGMSEEQFWTRPFAEGNSFGHLVLHLTGNLSYYIGAEIAGTGYVREREREFTDANPPPKAEALARLDRAVEVVVAALARQSEADWALPYSAAGAEGTNDRFSIFLRCVSHFQHHVGQMIYLAREVARRTS